MMETWEKTARSLRIGSKRKIECCSADRSALVSNDHRGISLHCFRCKRQEFKPHGERSIAEILKTRREEDALAAQPLTSMPKDAVPLSEGPVEAWQWVLRGGLSPEDATRLHGMLWHEKTRRVLIPIRNRAGELIAMLGRNVHGERPKYRMIPGVADTFYRTPSTDSRTTVVVEDVLSGIAVARTGVNSVTILGTAVTAEHAAEICRDADTVLGWFDADAAGDAAWRRLHKRLRLYPVKLQRIQTAQDPKALHRQELRDIIKQHTGA